MMNDLPISPYKNFKYSISFEAWDEESLEIGQTDNRGVVVETSINTIGDILYEAGTTYGIYMPFAFGRWESTYPDEDTDYFEKGIRKFYTLHITNEDGTEITDEESDFITFLLSDGRYQLNKFRDYAVGGIVLGSIALGVGALITYFYFKDEKPTENKVEELAENKVEELTENKVKELTENKFEELTENEDVKSSNSRAKSVTHNINGVDKKFPIKDAWRKEHKIQNKQQKFEVPQGNRKPVKYEMGGDASEYYHEIEYGEGGVARAKDVIMNKIGFNEENANYLVSRSEKFSIWLADAILKKDIEVYNEAEESLGRPRTFDKKSMLDFINKRNNHIQYVYSSYIREILDWLQHPVTPKQDLRNLSFDEALEKATDWHNELQVLGGDIDFTEPETNIIIKKYPLNEEGIEYYWVLIPSNYCELESSRMGHCGRTGYGNNLISLRSVKPFGKGHTINDSHITIAYGSDGIFYQVKGKKNNKPSEKYFPLIFDLIKTMLVNSENESSIKIPSKYGDSVPLNFQGFGSEYHNAEDYGLGDMTNEEIRELYDLNPTIFEDAENIFILFEKGIITADELKEIVEREDGAFFSFKNQIKLYDLGIVSERPSTIINVEKDCSEVENLLEVDDDFRSDIVENILCGDTYELVDSFGYYYDNPSDLVNKLNEKNTEIVIDEIVSITGLEKSIVEENTIEHYLVGDDEDFSSDDFDGIISALANAQNNADNNDYHSYLYDNLKSALEKLGTVHSLNDEGVKMTIDLSNLMSYDEISEQMDYYGISDVTELFNEEISNSYGGAIEKPKFYIDSRYSAYGSDEDFNDNFEIYNYSKGGTLRPKNINTNKKTKIKNMKPNQKKYAQGGLTEHGLKVGDKIIFDHISDENIDIKDSDGNKHIVDLDRGIRYANGGEVGEEEIDDFVYEYGVSRKEAEETLKRRKGRLSAKENLRLKELSRKNKNVGLTLTDSEEIEFDKLVHKYRGWDYKMANGGEAGNKTIKNIRKKRPKTRQPKMVRQYFEDEAYAYADGGRITSNDGIIEAFLTSERQLKVGNLSTHFNEYDNQMLLRNYGTLIATRKGNNVEITNVKYSQTTSRITNKVNSMAMQKGMNVSYVSKFADGGDVVKEPTQSELNKMTAFDLMDAMKNDKKNYEIYKKQLLTLYPDAKGFADGGEAGQYVLENRGRLGYAVLNTKTNMYVDIDFQSKEDAENFIIEKNREKRLFGFEPRLNIGSEGFADGGEAGGKSTKRPIRKKTQPKIVRQYFEDEAFEYAGGGSINVKHSTRNYKNTDEEIDVYEVDLGTLNVGNNHTTSHLITAIQESEIYDDLINELGKMITNSELYIKYKDKYGNNYRDDWDSSEFYDFVIADYEDGGKAGDDLEKLQDVHEKIREILIENGSEEYGDSIIDEISEAVGISNTNAYYDEDEEYVKPKKVILKGSASKKDLEKLEEIHEKIREILIENGNEEYGDLVIDQISEVVGIPTTIAYYNDEDYAEGGETYSLSDFPIYANEDGEVRFVRNPKKDVGKGEDKEYAISVMIDGKVDKYADEYFFDTEKKANLWVGKLNKFQEQTMTNENKQLVKDWFAENDDRISELIYNELRDLESQDFKYYVKNQGNKKFAEGGEAGEKFAKGGMFGGSAKLEYIGDAYASDEMADELRKKLKIKGDSLANKDVISFAYTDYGGDFLDKVAIAYFSETYPKNTIAENSGFGGKNAFVFGEPAKQWIEQTEDYPLGFEDFEDFYMQQENEQEGEDFNYFLDEISKEYTFDKETVLNWLGENKGGYYGMTTQGLDFSYEDLTEELVNEGLIEKIEEDDEYAEGGEIQDWMEEALESLIEETGNETLDITMVSNSGTEFFASNQNEEYRVFKSEDDAELTAEDEVREDMEDMPENFNQDFIINYIDGGDYFEQSLMEMNTSYADDIENESDSRYGSRLIAEMIDYGLMDEDEAESENAEELAEEYKYDFVSLLTEEQMNQGNKGFDYFVSNFGEEETMKMVIKNNLIDIYRASKDAVQIDGVGHFLSRYDGETLYLSNGYVAFRNN